MSYSFRRGLIFHLALTTPVERWEEVFNTQLQNIIIGDAQKRAEEQAKANAAKKAAVPTNPQEQPSKKAPAIPAASISPVENEQPTPSQRLSYV